MRLAYYGRYKHAEALQAVRLRLAPGQQAALLPALEAANDSWCIALQGFGNGNLELRMSLEPIVAHVTIEVTKAGRIKSIHGIHGAEKPQTHWILSDVDSSPVPAVPDWPRAAADWVTARNAELTEEAAVEYEIATIEQELASARELAESTRRHAEEFDARVATLSLRLGELKNKLHQGKV